MNIYSVGVSVLNLSFIETDFTLEPTELFLIFNKIEPYNFRRKVFLRQCINYSFSLVTIASLQLI